MHRGTGKGFSPLELLMELEAPVKGFAINNELSIIQSPDCRCTGVFVIALRRWSCSETPIETTLYGFLDGLWVQCFGF